jgi:O-antigen biosynthesis protein WbqP
VVGIIRGQMSCVGPTAALFNQEDLVTLRTSKGIHQLMPGPTWWAQINGRDEFSIPSKAEFDAYYLTHRSFLLDLTILYNTLLKVGLGGEVHP